MAAITAPDMQVQEDKPYDEINITPMLDLAYVLLVIFILMTTATVAGLKASLPRASKNPPTKKKDEEQKLKAITVDNTGTILMDNARVTLPDLEARLKAHQAKFPEFPVIIKGDSATPYQVVIDVLEVTQRLGIKQVGLPTKAR
jgi:biopolymer transport protein ExbD